MIKNPTMPFSHQLTARRARLAKYSPMGGCAEGLLCCRHLLAVKAGGPDGDYTWFISPPARRSRPTSSSQERYQQAISSRHSTNPPFIATSLDGSKEDHHQLETLWLYYSVIAGAVFGFWLWFGALEVGPLRLQHQCHAKLHSVSHNAVFFDVFSQLHYKLWM